MILRIKTMNRLLYHFPSNPFPPLECNFNLIEFLLNMFGMQTIPGLLNNISGIIEVIIIFEILNDFHGPITPFLGFSHKLGKGCPFEHSDGEDHFGDGRDDLVPGLFCS